MHLKKVYTRDFWVAMLSISFLLFACTTAFAVPGKITYQGKLANADGTPVADGIYSLYFRIYDVASGGTALWEENQSVSVVNGIYNVFLPSDPVSNPFPEDLLNNSTIYLGITVEADSEMAPRQEITSCFYALKAGDTDSISGQTLSDLDDTYVNENQENSITSSMIVDSTIGSADLGANSVGSSEIASGAVGSDEIADNSVSASDLQDGAALAEILDDDGSGSLLDADLLDGHDIADFVLHGGDYGRSGVADNLYEGTSTLSSKYVNEGQVNSITGSMIVNGTVTSADVRDNSLTSADLATNSVGSSEIASRAVGPNEIAWSINYSGKDSNGGLISLTNESDGTPGNIPAGILGSAAGSPNGSRIVGVLGATPQMGSNPALSRLPPTRIGVAGSATEGYGVAGVSTGGRGIFAYSSGDDALYAKTDASDKHAGYFNTDKGSGLNGAALYARSFNTTNDGIAFWAENAHNTSTDATAVLSNAGSGPLLKGFGGNGGEDEFRFDNDGTLHLYNGDHTETVQITPSEHGSVDGGQIIFKNNIGKTTVEVDGDFNDYGRIDLRDEDANLRLTLTGSYSGTNKCGAVLVKNNSGISTVQIIGEYSATGNGRVITQELQITGGSDLSEQFDVHGDLSPLPGMVVCIDPDRPGKLRISNRAYDKKVAGIISGAGGVNTGLMMGQPGTKADGGLPVALTGRVYCMADASNGPIEPGDLLTTSTVPGRAMKVTDYNKANGAIIGKAMSSLKKGEGLILVLVTLQ